MKLLFVFLVIATVVTVIRGYSEDDHWKDFKVNKPIPRDNLNWLSLFIRNRYLGNSLTILLGVSN